MNKPKGNPPVPCRKNGPLLPRCCLCVSLLKYLLLGLILCWIYLNLVGFPHSAFDNLQQELNAHDIELEFARIRLNIFRGIIADDVSLYKTSQTGRANFLECKHVSFDLHWDFWKTGHKWLKSFSILEGHIQPAAAGIFPEEILRPLLVVEDLSGTVTIEPGWFRLDALTARVLGLPVSGSGRIHKSTHTYSGTTGSAITALEKTSNERFLNNLWREVEALRFSEDSKAEFTFNIYPDQFEKSSAHIEAGGRELTIRTLDTDQWKTAISLQGPEIHLHELSITHLGQRARWTGKINTQEKTVSTHIYSSLFPSSLLTLLPYRWGEMIQPHLQMKDGDVEGEFWLGPVPFDEAADTFEGWIKFHRANVSGIWIEKGFTLINWDAPVLTLSEFDAHCGTGEDSGSVKGQFEMIPADGSWKTQIETTLDPELLLPVAPTSLHNLIHRFAFTQHNPRIELDMAFTPVPSPTLVFTGEADVEDCSYNDVAVSGIQLDLKYADKEVTLDPLTITRPEGQTRGWLSLDFGRNMAAFDFESTVHPQATAGMITRNLGTIIRNINVQGEGRWTAMGLADLTPQGRSDFDASATLSQAEILFFESDDVDLEFQFRGSNLFFDIHPTEFYGGTITGKFDVVLNEPGIPFDSTFIMRDANLNDLTHLGNPQAPIDVGGNASALLRLSGKLDPFRLADAVGRGRVRINDGSLFRIPLFGGLSRLLSKVIPGLGFTSQTDFTAHYTIQENKIASDNILISGNLASIAMKGHYTFGEQLNFDVEARPLGPGLMGRVVNLVTFPISKLFQLELRGTLGQPEWNMKHLPGDPRSSEATGDR